LTIFAPSSVQELRVMLRTAVELEGPASVRYPRGKGREVPADQVGAGLNARRLQEGDGEVCILAVGKMLEAAEQAAAILADDGVLATVWDVRLVRPLDPTMVTNAAQHQLVVTVEDGIRLGGAGASIADAIADLQESRQGPPVLVLGTPPSYIPHGDQASILAQLGLDGAGIAAATQKALHALRLTRLSD
jgi:1-deoxy-D-xylulose-5-phosphate synthase